MSWNDKRPMSPHLQVYKLPLTAFVSIGHRATGIVNTLALVLLVWALANVANGETGFALALLQSWFGKIVMFGFTFTLYFHMCNGIRHLFWDAGLGFDLDTADKTAKLVFAGAAALTAITWIVAGAA